MKWQRWRLALLVVPVWLGVSLSACAVPDADRSIAAALAAQETPERLSPSDGSLPLDEADLPEDVDGMLQRHLVIEEAVAGTPLTGGNRTQVLRDGAETFRAIAAAIKQAKHHINLEYYTIEDVALENGVALSDLLIARRAEGVAVNILYDAYGSSDTPPAFFERLKAAGVNLLAYHPLDPNPVNVINLNNRNHRKILVVDGRVGVVGGVNLSSSYESKSPGSSGSGDDDDDATAEIPLLGAGEPLPDEWRDTAIRLEGPAVVQLQELFRDHWLSESGPLLDMAGFFPTPAPAYDGGEVVRIIGSTPDEEIPRYYVTLISALRGAERRAWISAAYFVPTPEQKEELIKAAERGVDVRLLLADRSDSEDAIAAAQSHYSDLLRAGVKIHETRDVVLHAKTVVIDGVWSAIGSSNFDFRSVLHNAEVDAVVVGTQTAREMEAIFRDGMAIAVTIDLESWEAERTFPQRLRGFVSRLWEFLL